MASGEEAVDGLQAQAVGINFVVLEDGLLRCGAEGHEAYVYPSIEQAATHFIRAHAHLDEESPASTQGVGEVEELEELEEVVEEIEE